MQELPNKNLQRKKWCQQGPDSVQGGCALKIATIQPKLGPQILDSFTITQVHMDMIITIYCSNSMNQCFFRLWEDLLLTRESSQDSTRTQHTNCTNTFVHLLHPGQLAVD